MQAIINPPWDYMQLKLHFPYRLAFNMDNPKLRGQWIIFLGWFKHPLLGIIGKVALMNDDGSSGEEWLVRFSCIIKP